MKKLNKFKKKNIFFSVRTIYETIFYSKIIKLGLKKNSFFLCFDQECYEYLNRRKFKAFQCYNKVNFKYINKKKINYQKKIFHEKNEFKIKNNNILIQKYNLYYENIKKILSNFNKKNLIIVQEIGGFISHQSLFDYCKFYKINHFFLEPSFFNGKFILIKNNFLIEKFKIKKKISKKILIILKKLEKQKKISYIGIHKTRYRSAIKKVLDLTNISRFFQKIFRKKILKYHYDYSYIFHYVFMHFKMIFNSFIINFLVTKKIPKKYIYFPLHVPNDISLTLRCKKFYDQFLLIKKILFTMPKEYELIIKEHPSFSGRYNLIQLIQLLLVHKNLKIVPYYFNNYNLMKNSKLVLTINSKSGCEAIILQKEFIYLANSFYSSFQKPEKRINISKFLKHRKIITKEKKLFYFSSLYNFLYEGELFNTKNSNLVKFKRYFDNL